MNIYPLVTQEDIVSTKMQRICAILLEDTHMYQTYHNRIHNSYYADLTYQDIEGVIIYTRQTASKFWEYIKRNTQLQVLLLRSHENFAGNWVWALTAGTLPSVDGKLTHLHSLSVTFSTDMTQLPDFSSFQQLQFLSIHLHLPAAVTPEQYLAACEVFSHLPASLQYIQVRLGEGFSTAQVETFLQHLSTCDSLKCVFITRDKGYHYTDAERFLSAQQGLQLLSLVKTDIKHLPSAWTGQHLQFLRIRQSQLTQLPIFLEKIQTADFQECPQLQLDHLLQQLNPTSLNRFILDKCKITALPKQIKHFEQLTYLSLKSNKLTQLPIELYTLKRLRTLRVSGNPIQKTEVKNGKPLLTLFNNFEKLDLTEEYKRVQTALFTENDSFLSQYNLTDLIRFAFPAGHRGVEHSLLTYAEKKLQNPFEQPQFKEKEAHLALYGKLQSLRITDVRKALAEKGITFTTKITPQTTHICLGEKLNKGEVTALAKTSLPLASPLHLKRLVEEISQPYLSQAEDETMLTSLKELLMSKDSQNVELAIQMMQKGGIPFSLLSMVILVLLSKNHHRDLYTKLQRLLQKQISNDLYVKLSDYRRKWVYKNLIKDLSQTGELLPSDLAKALIELVAHEVSIYTYLRADCTKLLLKESEESANWVLQYYTKKSILRYYNLPLQPLFNTKGDLTRIEAMALGTSWQHMKSYLKRLKQFTHLKVLYFMPYPGDEKYLTVVENIKNLYPHLIIKEEDILF
ncbi:MAG: leucine-rich repeat domain-containing protein [Thermonemataceae bacterium]